MKNYSANLSKMKNVLYMIKIKKIKEKQKNSFKYERRPRDI